MSKEIKLKCGEIALIDDEDIEMVSRYSWYKSTNGYVVSGARKGGIYKSILLHRLVMSFPDAMVDHKDGNKLDCRKRNLRLSTNQQNTWNNRKTYGEFGLRGIKVLAGGTWSVRFRIHGKNRHVGCYPSLAEAIEVYNREVEKLRGEFAVLNDVSDESIAQIETMVRSKVKALRETKVLGKANISGYRGVSPVGHKWRAVIKLDYQQISLGRYETPQDAAYVYDQVALQLFGNQALTNLL